MFADLHCHTNQSDHSESAETVLQMAHMAGVTHLAITNHDTTAGLAEAMQLGERIGIEVIPGIEISAFDYVHKRNAHVIGLYVPPNHPELDRFCVPTLEARDHASYLAVQRLIEHGYPISWEVVQTYATQSKTVYKQHIMHALLDAGIADAIHGSLYKQLFSGKDAIARFSIDYVDVIDAIQLVKKVGGIPVIAHPGQLNNWEAIPDWVEAGLEGIEVWHPDHSEEDIAKAFELSERYALLRSGGADHHGRYGRPDIGFGRFGVQGIDFENIMKKKKSIEWIVK